MSSLRERLARVLEGSHRIERELGSGGMGVVFLAHDLALDRPVAIKVLRPERATAVGIERFVREGRLLARLEHPNIVRVHDARSGDGLAFLIMAVAPGETLADRLTHGPLSPSEAHTLARHLLAALALAHRHGVVHRDVKPANIFIGPGGAQLGDFGVAQVDTEPGELTEPGSAVGTPQYLAPEQAAGASATPRSDVYAAGLVLYESVTGRRIAPGTAASAAQLRALPSRMRPAIARALAWSPRDRWPDAGAFAAALDGASGRRGLVRRLAGTAVLVLAGVIGWRVFRPPLHAAPPGHADLALLPCSDGDTALANSLVRLTTSQLEWFPRLSIVPYARTGTAEALRHGSCRLTGRDSSLAFRLEVRDSAERLLHQIHVPGAPDEELAWSRRIADSVVSAVWPGFVVQFRELARYGTSDVEAMRELIAGEDAFHRGDFATAEQRIEAALARAPRLAQARWRRALLLKWTRRPSDGALRQVLELSPAELPPYYRALAEAQLEADVRVRLARFESMRPQDSTGEAEFLLLNELFHRGPLVGARLDTTLDRIRSGSGRSTYLARALADEMLWGNIRLGRRDDARHALENRARIAAETPRGSDSRSRYALLKLAYDARFIPWLASLEARFAMWQADSAARDALSTQLRVAATFDTPRIQLQFGHALCDEAAPAAVHVRAHIAQAVALAMLGRPAAAVGHLDSAAALSGDPELRLQSLEWRLLLPAIGLPLPAADVQAARRALAAWPADAPHAVRAQWALAAEAYGRSALAEGDAATRRLDSLMMADTAAPSAHRLAATVAAMRVAAAGDPAAALALSDSVLGDDSFDPLVDPFARSLLYLARGTWALALGDTAGAERAWGWHENSAFRDWPTGPPQPVEIDAIASVGARLRRAELARARPGDRSGCGLASRVDELWSDPEPALDALRMRVRALRSRCA